MIPENCTTIIFDLGGVFLDIDYTLTENAFQQLGATDFHTRYTQATQSGLFDAYEVGKISSAHFINKIMDFMPSGTDPNKVVHAWNAMIKEIPAENLVLLRSLRKNYQLIALSNTNELHVNCFEGKLKKHGTTLSMNDFFDHVYYSNVLEMRKPHPETFQHLCNLHQLDKSKTLFVDDTIHHIEGAQICGLNTIHFTQGAYQLKTILE